MIPYVLGVIPSDTIASGTQNSILCREEGSPESYQLMLNLNSQLPTQIASAYDYTIYYKICEAWGVELAETWENLPISSDVPTLIFSGEFDPITPTDWAELAYETLSNAYLYVMPGHGHGVMRSNSCGFEIGLQFLIDPDSTPDASCIEIQPGIQFE